MINVVMNNSPSALRSRRPVWLTSIVAVLLILAVIWTLGVTVFRGALENRGLPEEIRGASPEQLSSWQFGAELSSLAHQAGSLAQLAQSETAQSLRDLHESLSQGAALLGQIDIAQAPEQPVPSSYSPESAQKLATEVLALNQQSDLVNDTDPYTASVVVRTLFEVSLDARDVLLASNPEAETKQIDAPLSALPETSPEDAASSWRTGCLKDSGLLDPHAPIPADSDLAAVHTARALDRGYALGYVLQLQAARGASETAPEKEAELRTLNEQLAEIRATLADDCADLRLLAYTLPDESSSDPSALLAGLEIDYVNELLEAIAATSGQAQSQLASMLWQNLSVRQDNGNPAQLLWVQ